MLFRHLRYKLAKKKVIKHYIDFIDLEHLYISQICHHYFDYFTFLQKSVMRRYDLFREHQIIEKFRDDCTWLNEDIIKAQLEFEKIMKRFTFKIKVVRTLNKKGLLEEVGFTETARIMCDDYDNYWFVYQKNFKEMNPSLLFKKYVMEEKLKRLQGDF